MEEYSLTVC
jgi:hypothetical protein